jgi:hypothetical protein
MGELARIPSGTTAKIAAAGAIGTAAAFAVPAAAFASPIVSIVAPAASPGAASVAGQAGGAPAIPPAPTDPAATSTNPVVPVAPGTGVPSITGLGNSNGVIALGCALDACLQAGGWSNGALIFGAGAGLPGFQVMPQFGAQPTQSSWGIVGTLQSPLSAIPGLGGSLNFKYDTAAGLTWQFSASANSNGGAISQTYVPGQGWVWNDPKQTAGYGVGASSSILGYRIIGPPSDPSQPYPTGDGMMSYPPGYQPPPAQLNDWSGAFGPDEQPPAAGSGAQSSPAGMTFQQQWDTAMQSLQDAAPGAAQQQVLGDVQQFLQGPAPAGISQEAWDSIRQAIQGTVQGSGGATPPNASQPDPGQPDTTPPPADTTPAPADTTQPTTPAPADDSATPTAAPAAAIPAAAPVVDSVPVADPAPALVTAPIPDLAPLPTPDLAPVPVPSPVTDTGTVDDTTAVSSVTDSVTADMTALSGIDTSGATGSDPTGPTYVASLGSGFSDG